MSYETELLQRVAAMQLEAMTSIGVKADAKPYFYHTQDDFPYFTNRIAANPRTDNGAEDFDFNTPTVVMRLVVGHLTEGYRGEVETRLYEWGPVVSTWFQEHMWLTSAAFPERMDNLSITRLTDNGGLRAFQDSGIDATQVGREIQFTFTFDEYIEQDEY